MYTHLHLLAHHLEWAEIIDYFIRIQMQNSTYSQFNESILYSTTNNCNNVALNRVYNKEREREQYIETERERWQNIVTVFLKHISRLHIWWDDKRFENEHINAFIQITIALNID